MSVRHQLSGGFSAVTICDTEVRIFDDEGNALKTFPAGVGVAILEVWIDGYRNGHVAGAGRAELRIRGLIRDALDNAPAEVR